MYREGGNEGRDSCESLQLIASARAQYLTVTNQKSPSAVIEK